jgi:two-component system sensor histidine kinase DegS
MYDNNLYVENDSEENVEERKTACILLRDLAVDFEEQLYSVKVQLKTQSMNLKENEQRLEENNRTNDRNQELFYPIHSQGYNSKNIIAENEQIKQKISELENKQNMLICKINGLKTAAKYLDISNKKKEKGESEKGLENKTKLTDKGLGILEAQEIERQRIARDLHDTTVQNLTSLVHKSELCIKLLDIDMIRAKLELSSMSSTLKMIINDMRGIIYNLKPMTLDDLGLTITIQRYANRIINLNNIQVKVTSNEEPKEILSVIKLTIFRIIQEACNNIIKHAKASSINIDINYQDSIINVVISDNGMGFNIEGLDVPEQSSSFGLSIMKERITLLSGTLDIKSVIGKGTTVSMTVPLAIYEGGEK